MDPARPMDERRSAVLNPDSMNTIGAENRDWAASSANGWRIESLQPPLPSLDDALGAAQRVRQDLGARRRFCHFPGRACPDSGQPPRLRALPFLVLGRRLRAASVASRFGRAVGANGKPSVGQREQTLGRCPPAQDCPELVRGGQDSGQDPARRARKSLRESHREITQFSMRRTTAWHRHD